MAWRCELTGKTRQIGNRVSHSNRKTKRRFLPNLLNVTLLSDSLGRSVRLRISANALKSVDHRGGLDSFLLAAKDAELSARALELKRQVAKKRTLRRRRLRAQPRAQAYLKYLLSQSSVRCQASLAAASSYRGAVSLWKP